MAKTTQLQIRVSPKEKRDIRDRARRAGLPVSAYVLHRLRPADDARVPDLIAGMDSAADIFAFAELHDALAALTPGTFSAAVADVRVEHLSPLVQNYVAAMVEETGRRLGVLPPAWAADVLPLDHPVFAVPFARLRPHLLRSAPVAFKRRNIFVDATIGNRV